MNFETNSFKNEFIPQEFHLEQNYPNPFKDKTTITYCVPCKTKVIMIVINSEGKIVEKLISKEQEAGIHEVEFNLHKNHSGSIRPTDGDLPEGTYFYQLIAVPTGGQAEEYINTKTMILLK